MAESDIINLLAEYGIFDVISVDNLDPLEVLFDINVDDFIVRSLDILNDKFSSDPTYDAYKFALIKLPKGIYSFRYKYLLDYAGSFKKSEDEVLFLEYLQEVFNAINYDYRKLRES